MDELLIQSNIPPKDTDYIESRHFRFSLEGVDFSIRPLGGRGLKDLSEDIRYMLILLMYREFSIEDIAKMLSINKDEMEPDANKIALVKRKLQQAQSLIDILLKLLEPVPFWVTLRLCWKHNLKYWFTPKVWVFRLKEWFGWYLPSYDPEGKGLIDVLSWLYRYSEGEKKKISQVLQGGIGNATEGREVRNETQSRSIEEESRQVSQSLGMMILGLDDA
jgi:hypothetical protein